MPADRLLVQKYFKIATSQQHHSNNNNKGNDNNLTKPQEQFFEVGFTCNDQLYSIIYCIFYSRLLLKLQTRRERIQQLSLIFNPTAAQIIFYFVNTTTRDSEHALNCITRFISVRFRRPWTFSFISLPFLKQVNNRLIFSFFFLIKSVSLFTSN